MSITTTINTLEHYIVSGGYHWTCTSTTQGSTWVGTDAVVITSIYDEANSVDVNLDLHSASLSTV